jgi:hypothetical protein
LVNLLFGQIRVLHETSLIGLNCGQHLNMLACTACDQ